MKPEPKEDIQNFNSALEAIGKISEAFQVELLIPSLKRTVAFKEINAKQQKELLHVAIDNSMYSTGFNRVFHKILTDNILNEDASVINELTISDKVAVAIGLRAQISPEINVVFDEKANLSKKFELSEITKRFIFYSTPELDTVSIEQGDVVLSAKISLPTIGQEMEYDEHINRVSKKTNNVQNKEDVQNIIADAFIGETTKYIRSIGFGENEMDMGSCTPALRIRVVEKLPSGLIQKILERVSEWKKEVDKIMTVEHDGRSKVISVDSMLFLS